MAFVRKKRPKKSPIMHPPSVKPITSIGLNISKLRNRFLTTKKYHVFCFRQNHLTSKVTIYHFIFFCTHQTERSDAKLLLYIFSFGSEAAWKSFKYGKVHSKSMILSLSFFYFFMYANDVCFIMYRIFCCSGSVLLWFWLSCHMAQNPNRLDSEHFILYAFLNYEISMCLFFFQSFIHSFIYQLKW